MTEAHSDQTVTYPQDYIQRLTALLDEIDGWCRTLGLQTERHPVAMHEESTGRYEGPGLRILKDGMPVAKMVPVGSQTIAADGRVDLAGRICRHVFLFYLETNCRDEPTAIVDGRCIYTTSPIRRGVDRDGWYWLESKSLRVKRVDENLFIDLLMDVSDHAF